MSFYMECCAIHKYGLNVYLYDVFQVAAASSEHDACGEWYPGTTGRCHSVRYLAGLEFLSLLWNKSVLCIHIPSCFHDFTGLCTAQDGAGEYI